MSTTTLKQQVCASCRIVFAIPEDFVQARLNDGATFYCPVGHHLVFKETTAKRLERELAVTKAHLEAEQARRAVAEHEARAATTHAKREVTRRRNLQDAIDAGVCPRCKRHFRNVRRHMEGMHGEH